MRSACVLGASSLEGHFELWETLLGEGFVAIDSAANTFLNQSVGVPGYEHEKSLRKRL